MLGATVFVTAERAALPVAVQEMAFGAVVVGLPLAAGLAILRYRLYDIDRVINRTVSYGLLSALLGAVYLVTVRQLPRALGIDPDSAWLVSGATLTVAALFHPARRRIQVAVDRRFNRAKYDAEETVATFSTQLRDEVELVEVSAMLLDAVHRSVQPAQATMWLRPLQRQRRALQADESDAPPRLSLDL